MNYAALIQNRRSYREFTDRQVAHTLLVELREYHTESVRRLLPKLRTQLHILGPEARSALEGAAGYHKFLVGAPHYLVLLSEKHSLAHLNAGFVMQDLLLKAADMEVDSCWLTFTNSDEVKAALGIENAMEVVAIAALGYGKKAVKRMRLNFRSMSDVDLRAKYRYMEPKRSIQDLAFAGTWGNDQDLEKYIGFYDDMLWEALYAASLAPSYLNRQAYGFVLHDGCIYLVSRPDAYNTRIDGDLSLGVVLLHFTAVAETWGGPLKWDLAPDGAQLNLPPDHLCIASAPL